MRTRTWVLLILAAAALVSLGVGTAQRRDRTGDAGGAGTADGVGGDAIIVLDVLNGTAVPGLAADVSLALGRVGATADRFANAPHDTFARSLLVNRRLDEDRAAALARRLGGVQLLFEHDPVSRADAVLVLGADHARVKRALGMATVRR